MVFTAPTQLGQTIVITTEVSGDFLKLMLDVITLMDYINPSKLFCLEMGCFKPYFNMVK